MEMKLTQLCYWHEHSWFRRPACEIGLPCSTCATYMWKHCFWIATRLGEIERRQHKRQLSAQNIYSIFVVEIKEEFANAENNTRTRHGTPIN